MMRFSYLFLFAVWFVSMRREKKKMENEYSLECAYILYGNVALTVKLSIWNKQTRTDRRHHTRWRIKTRNENIGIFAWLCNIQMFSISWNLTFFCSGFKYLDSMHPFHGKVFATILVHDIFAYNSHRSPSRSTHTRTHSSVYLKQINSKSKNQEKTHCCLYYTKLTEWRTICACAQSFSPLQKKKVNFISMSQVIRIYDEICCFFAKSVTFSYILYNIYCRSTTSVFLLACTKMNGKKCWLFKLLKNLTLRYFRQGA